MQRLRPRDPKEAREAENVQISLICSVYNAERYLTRYIQSLETQRLINFEIVFADASSTDRSLDILRDYAPRQGIKKKLIQFNSKVGIYTAWNTLIAASSGTWIMNYNCDDYLFPEALTTLKTVAEQELEYDFIYSPCLITDSPSHSPTSGYSDWRDASKPGALASGCCCGPFPMVRKELFVRHGLFREDMVTSGDYEMWCRLHKAGIKMLKIKTPIGSYFRNPAGISTSQENRQIRIAEDLIARKSLE